jgi:hypothetical protein
LTYRWPDEKEEKIEIVITVVNGANRGGGIETVVGGIRISVWMP